MTKTEAVAVALAKAEPTFRPQFEAALRVLNAATVVAGDALHWASGATCGPGGCSCGNPACLHRVAWRIFRHE